MTNVANTDATAISDERLAEMKLRLVEQIRLLNTRMSRSAIPEDGWEYSGLLADAALKLALITELQERRRNTLPTSVTDEQVGALYTAIEQHALTHFRKEAVTLFTNRLRSVIRAALSAAALPPSRDDAVGVDRLPTGHVVLEAAERLDGLVSQTVRRPNGNEYERVVSAEEAYGSEDGE